MAGETVPIERASRWWPLWVTLVGLFGFVFCGLYAFTNPIFEAPDEPDHVEYVAYVARTRRLPNQEAVNEACGQGHHFPLFYGLGAGLSLLTGESNSLRIDALLNPARCENGGNRADVPRFVSGDDGRGRFGLAHEYSILCI
jgi:hypothetical protein